MKRFLSLLTCLTLLLTCIVQPLTVNATDVSIVVTSSGETITAGEYTYINVYKYGGNLYSDTVDWSIVGDSSLITTALEDRGSDGSCYHYRIRVKASSTKTGTCSISFSAEDDYTWSYFVPITVKGRTMKPSSNTSSFLTTYSGSGDYIDIKQFFDKLAFVDTINSSSVTPTSYSVKCYNNSTNELLQTADNLDDIKVRKIGNYRFEYTVGLNGYEPYSGKFTLQVQKGYSATYIKADKTSVYLPSSAPVTIKVYTDYDITASGVSIGLGIENKDLCWGYVSKNTTEEGRLDVMLFKNSGANGITTVTVTCNGSRVYNPCSASIKVMMGTTVTSTPTPIPTKKPTSTPTPTKKPTSTPTLKPTATPTVKPTNTPKPTATPTVKPTATPTVKPTSTPKPTATPTVTTKPTSTPKPTATSTPSPTLEPTKALEISPTSVPTVSPTLEPTKSATPTSVPTATPKVVEEKVGKSDSYISVGSLKYTKVQGDKPFNIISVTNSDSGIYYVSSNTNVVKVNKGKVTIVGSGIANIVLTTNETNNYKATSKIVKVIVKPKKTTISSVKSSKKKSMVVKFKKIKGVSYYKLQYSTSKYFKNYKTVKLKNTVTSKTIKGLKSGKRYYVRIKAYKTTSNKVLSSTWSNVKSVKVK